MIRSRISFVSLVATALVSQTAFAGGGDIDVTLSQELDNGVTQKAHNKGVVCGTQDAKCVNGTKQATKKVLKKRVISKPAKRIVKK